MYTNKLKIFLWIIFSLSTVFKLSSQSGSFGSTFAASGGEMAIFGQHDFQNGTGKINAGIIATERVPQIGLFSWAPGSSWINANDNAFVDGYARTYLDGNFTFPIGDNASYRPAAVSAASLANPASAAYYGVNASSAITSSVKGGNEPVLPSGGPFPTGSKEADVQIVSTLEYWDIDGSTSAKISLTWNVTSNVSTMTSGILSSLTIVGWDGSKWVKIPSTVDATSIIGGNSSLTSGSITTNAVLVPSSYTVYTLAGAVADSDGDGVTDAQELTDGTNPNDGCSYLASSQVYASTTLAWRNLDCDSDGLTNQQELDPNNDGTPGPNGTNPTNPDSDGDGLYDGEEITGVDNPATLANPGGMMTNPNNVDTDGDGVTDGAERTSTGASDPLTDATNNCSLNVGEQTVSPSVAWNAADCDNDGTNNGIDPQPTDPCKPNANALACPTGDTDGDGVTNGQESIDGTNPNDGCSYNSASQVYASTTLAWRNLDCDSDGLTNQQELDPNNDGTPGPNGTNPTNPDSDGDGLYDGEEITGVDNPATLANPGGMMTNPNNVDTDGDGVTDGAERTSTGASDPLTDATNNCSLNVGEQTVSPSVAWNAADCDNDGTNNGIDPQPTDPCKPNANALACPTGDTDGDGVTNGQESIDGTNPNDGCSYLAVSQVYASTTLAWKALDCDSDGLTNGQEVDPNNDGTAGPNGMIPTNPDSDGDGLYDGEEVTGVDNPATPANPGGMMTNPNNVDTDGDGVTDGAERTSTGASDPLTDATNNCSLNVGEQTVSPSVAWNAADCDNDGTNNGIDPQPTDPCKPNANALACPTGDTDGDGVTNGQESIDGTNPNDGCSYLAVSQVYASTTLAWKALDCDSDGLTNGQEVDPNNDGTAGPNGMIPTNPDSDGDGLYDGEEVTGVDNPATPANPGGMMTNPNNVDTDGDGVTDGDERTNTGSSDPLTDANNGCNYNLAEQVYANTSTIWRTQDCDCDGLNNGIELDPDQNGVFGPGSTDPLVADNAIGSFVWHDLNGNGQKDIDEYGIAGVQVNLYKGDGTYIATQFTDINGYFIFDALCKGDYYIKCIQPTGFERTFPNKGNDNTDSDLDDVNGSGTTSTIHLEAGERDLTWGIGYYQCIPVGDLVWYDINKNDVWDTNENGLNGLKVNLWRNHFGTWVIWDYTLTGHKPDSPSDDGYFKFCAPPGQYYVQIELPPLGLVRARPNIGSVEEIDSDITNSNGPVTTDLMTLLSGQEKCNLGAGFYPQATTGNLVWVDANANGIHEPQEAKMANVQVQAILIATGEVKAEAVTDSEGTYIIEGLEKQAYYLKFTPPSGYFATVARVASDDIDSDVDHTFGTNTTRAFDLQPATAYENIDMGLVFSPLPVTWLEVSAERVKDTHVISWKVAKEVNVSHYVVERKLESESEFYTISDKVIAKGNVTPVLDYNLTDFEVDKSGVYIYRVKQYDYDGKFTFSNLAKVSYKGENSVELYPNPARSESNLHIVLTQDSDVKIEMYDATAKLIKLIKASGVQKAGDVNYMVNLQSIPTGVYNVIISINGIQDEMKLIKLE